MSGRKAYACMLLAALLIAAAGPAAAAKSEAKQQQSGSSTEKLASTKAKRECNNPVPPFMYNPRFSNRAMLKASKCLGQNK